MRYSFLFFVLLPLAAQDTAVSPDTVVLTVHGRKYTRAEFEQIADVTKSTPDAVFGRLTTGDGFARTKALADQAKVMGLDKRADVKARFEVYDVNLMSWALLQDLIEKAEGDEPALRARFAASPHVAEQRHVRHILIRTSDAVPLKGKLSPAEAKAKADAIRQRITNGSTFMAVAKTDSDDEKTKANGGDLGQLSKPLLIPQLGDAAFKMKAGEVSDPIKTTEGYHLLLVEKIFPPAFQTVRKALAYDIAREQLEKIVVSGIEKNPAYFKR